MSKQILPLRRQMPPEDQIKARAGFAKISLYIDLLDYELADLHSLLSGYNMSHQKRHELSSLIRMTRQFSALNSKSLGYGMAVDFGEACDAVREGVNKLFKEALNQVQGKNEKEKR